MAPSVGAAEIRAETELPSFSVDGFERGDFELARPVALPLGGRVTGVRSLPTRGPGFVKSYLLPRLSSRFDGLAPRHPIIIDDAHQRVDDVLYENLTAAAQRGAERGARDALTNFLIDSTVIGKLFGSKRLNRSSSAADPSSVEAPPMAQAAPRPSSKFGVGFSRGHPELEWRYRAAANSLRLRVNSVGAAGLAFSRSKQNQTDISVGYHPRRQQYALYLSHKF